MNSSSPSGINERRRLRREFRARRKSLSTAAQHAHAEAVTRHLLRSGLLLRGGAVAVYLADAAEGELDTRPLIRRLWRMRRDVVLPVVGSSRGFMNLHRYRPHTRLVRNRYGIDEPEPGSEKVSLLAVSVALLPLVAFDTAGGRLGMGGGYYDRFLGHLPPPLRPRLVGLAHEAQCCDRRLPRDAWDIPLDDVVTETGWRCFSFS